MIKKNMTNETTLGKIYYLQLIIMLVIAAFTNYSYFGVQKYIYYISITLSFVLFILYFLLQNVTISEIVMLSYLFCLLLIGLYYDNFMCICISIFSSSFIFFDSIDIFKIYGSAHLIVVILSLVLCLIGELPFFSSNGFVMGFAHKNTVGYFLCSAIIYILFLLNRKKILSFFIFLVFSVILFEIVQDRTATFILILFYFLNITKIVDKNKIIQKIIIILPILFIGISNFLIKNYFNHWWINNNLNNILSGRLYYWQYYWSMFNPKIIPQRLILINTPPFDGIFSSGPLTLGILVFSSLILIIIYGTYLLLKLHNSIILNYVVMLLCFGFTENIVFDSSVCCLLPILILVITKKNQIKDIKITY